MLKTSPSEITRTRMALLAYAARFGVTDDASRRLLVARLWRTLPRGLSAVEAINATDRVLARWASERVGFSITSAQLRLAVLETGADAMALLSDENISAFIMTILPVLPQPVPLETAADMPLQSLARLRLRSLFLPAAPYKDQAVRV